MSVFDEWVGFLLRWIVTVGVLLALPVWIADWLWRRYPSVLKLAILRTVRKDAVKREAAKKKKKPRLVWTKTLDGWISHEEPVEP